MENQTQQNFLVESADEYLRRNRIMDLFEDLATAATFKQPENLKDFIADEIRNKQKNGFTSGTFTQAEVKNTFELFDLKREGVIKKEKCRQALLTLAGSQHQQDIIEQTEVIDEEVEFTRFQRLCDVFMGIKQT